MNGYYYVVNTLKDYLKSNDFINTVSIGDIFSVDLNKQTIFPLSHIMINSAAYNGSTFNYSISVLCMDIVDESKEATTDIFVGNDNEQDVLNTQQMVATRLLEMLRRGDLFDDDLLDYIKVKFTNNLSKAEYYNFIDLYVIYSIISLNN